MTKGGAACSLCKINPLTTMNELNQRIITRTGMWVAAVVGSTYGLLLTIVGYLLDWGPGSGMEGPFWKVLLVGVPSLLIAAYVGVIIVRWLSGKLLTMHSQAFVYTVRSFVVVLLASIAAFVVGWEVGFLMGKLTGTFDVMGWGEMVLKVAGMAFIWSIPVCLIAGILYSIFVFTYLKARHNKP